MATARKSTPYGKARKLIFAEIKNEKVKFDASGWKRFELMWRRTIKHYFETFGAQAAARWREKKVHGYFKLAARRILRDAKKNAGGGKVTAAHLVRAADMDIPILRKHCPVVNPIGDVKPLLFGPVCRKY